MREIARKRGRFAEQLAALGNRGCSVANCAILAAALILGSVQPLLGVMAYQDSTPAFTLDICHPLQSLDHSPSVIGLALPSSPGRFMPIDFERFCEFAFHPLSEFVADIDPPPPKQAA
jgi:hypothetical protein